MGVHTSGRANMPAALMLMGGLAHSPSHLCEVLLIKIKGTHSILLCFCLLRCRLGLDRCARLLHTLYWSPKQICVLAPQIFPKRLL